MFFVHTAKAVRAGHPGDRLFVVSDTYMHGRAERHMAWKCTMTPQGIMHPGIKNLVRPTDAELAHLESMTGQARNGSAATADFKHDSFYELISPAQVQARIAAMKLTQGPKKKFKVLVQCQGKHDGYEGQYDWLNITGRVECVGRIPSEKYTKLLDAVEAFKAELERITKE